MCTVSFIPLQQGCLLTSNRDEKIVRQQAFAPQLYEGTTSHLLYPKDPDAGGTWIVMSDNGTAIVLLNGGFIAHHPHPPYRKSRGVILLEIAEKSDPVQQFNVHDLSNIEPFTLVIWHREKLYEARWDGNQKHLLELAANEPHIWSSVTLYDPAVIQKRQDWFKQWLTQHPNPDQDAIIKFHLFGGEGDAHNDIRMNRNGQMLTVSITGIHLTHSAGTMFYHDLRSSETHQSQISFADTHPVL